MIDISPFTEEQWNHMCRVNLSLPVPIHELERHKPFIYDRKWGVFYCPFGYHQAAMRALLGFHRGEPIDPLVMDVYEAADAYLELIQGTAFIPIQCGEGHCARMESQPPHRRRLRPDASSVARVEARPHCRNKNQPSRCHRACTHMIDVEFEFRAKGDKVVRRATLSLPCMPPMGYFVSRSIFGPMQPGDAEKPLLVIKDAMLSMRKWPTDTSRAPEPYVLAICKEPG